MAPTCRILVMASGNGSNFQAIIDAVADGRIPNSTIVQLVVNRGKAYATTRADNSNIPWEYFNLIAHGFQAKTDKDPESIQQARNKYDAALAKKILESNQRPDLIVLAGWMYIFGEHFLEPISKEGIKIINLHPALPGKYDGANAIERAYDDFQAGKLEGNKTGIMVHYVIKEVDAGEPLMTREIEIQKGETLDQVKERIHAIEHQLIVKATARVSQEILASKAQ
ncbi:formyl transferase [Schizothecium vesticola]|uniref:Phosphoribosylglycinamide formyltransferase n=1 Tax=Schizothecium vesticola TaxID=314040 RepID=A0AA40EW74_9PEZI|nr:formyl transferase [Schizothecium vesticola]